jgi:hypothetical protein
VDRSLKKDPDFVASKRVIGSLFIIFRVAAFVMIAAVDI